MQLILNLQRLKQAIKGSPRGKDEKTIELLQKAAQLRGQDASQYFYPDNPNAKTNFARLKRRAIEQLTSEICGSKPQGSKQLKAISSVTRNMYLLKLMAATSLRGSFARIGQKSYHEARHYHLTDLSIIICKELVMHFLILEVDLKRYEHYRKEYQKLIKIKQAEVQAELHLFDVYHQLTLSKHINQELQEKIKGHLLQIQDATPVSYWHGYLKYNLEVIYKEATGQKNDLLQICRKALAYFEGLDFEAPRNVLRSFTFRTVPLLILAGEFEAAEKAIKRTKRMSKTGSHNWLAIHQYECLLGFYSKDYIRCQQVMEAVSTHLKESNESWLIYQAYLYLFSHLGKHPKSRFKLGKFLNEVPVYSKDKKGMNINVLIIQIMVLLKDRRWPQIVDRIDALKAYTYRHLKTESTQRSDIFLSMLAILPKVAFQRSEAVERTQTLLLELKASPILSVDFEVVPYEDLWDIVLELLI